MQVWTAAKEMIELDGGKECVWIRRDARRVEEVAGKSKAVRDEELEP